ncbi:slr1084 [Synechocystis sp. PCC 6803]|uniref:Slr1084 protein n=1 Tax=Synechocystis sp. (strain ATCC 27184 / PCC 6803 / Kazusa) TaxID=1111708 RepID=P72921_SYNY3|nr:MULTISPECIES: hypothetical protein [unclassified Synechocystis]BAM50650.1 hypothetical protein BEST7613_1719 [Synechocystis sp. PCC 6803] [Bacillus subtilis BEST7613]AVP88549.1 hypothetical protein C7I86_01895 [Synechocystis sp. IPPAS B-1465]UOO12043.1 hypothetical protein MT986_01895 [Synechocystis sp. PCC 6803]BAA16938.1 slr1084 [Synechocystis sp. PCC 6803]BAK49110.1 hypothetical protein SYNGTS_0362 [Synechocystis sp. PCC 6803]
MQLNQYQQGEYHPGAPLFKQLLWYSIGDFLVQTPLLPMARLKVAILRLFGAKIGTGVNIKPHVKIKFPWRLTLGNYVWSKPSFDLITSPIHIAAGSWIGASAVIGPGVRVNEKAVLTLGSVAVKDLAAMTIYSGNPCQPVKKRQLL